MKPDFLIVGAMKAGTTSLYRDLTHHPDIFLPGDKEPNVLIEQTSNLDIANEYAKLFKASVGGQVCGEASTSYSKAPEHTGVAEKALNCFGKQLKVIYMRRDPIERIISQYKHELQHGTINVPFEDAMRQAPRFIDYSRYDWQISPWIKLFGEENVMQIDLEEYSRSRQYVLNDVIIFLGLSPNNMPKIDVDSVANRSDEAKSIGNPLLRLIVYSDFYQRRFKRLLSDEFRERVRNLILPKPKIDKIEPSKEMRNYILDELGKTTNNKRLT